MVSGYIWLGKLLATDSGFKLMKFE